MNRLACLLLATIAFLAASVFALAADKSTFLAGAATAISLRSWATGWWATRHPAARQVRPRRTARGASCWTTARRGSRHGRRRQYLHQPRSAGRRQATGDRATGLPADRMLMSCAYALVGQRPLEESATGPSRNSPRTAVRGPTSSPTECVVRSTISAGASPGAQRDCQGRCSAGGTS